MISCVIAILFGISLFFTFQISSSSHKKKQSSIFGNFGRHQDQEISEVTYPFSKTGSLSVTTKNGSIIVTTCDRKEIKVRTIKNGDKNDFGKIHSKVTFTKDSGSLEEVYDTAHEDSFSCDASVSYEIRVPSSVTITAKSKNGAISIADITGTVAATTLNGSLDCKHITGPCCVESKNGDLALHDVSHLTGATTLNGALTIKSEKLYSSLSPIKITSKNGTIVFEVREIEKNRIEVDTVNGYINIKVTKPQWLINTQQLITFTTGPAFIKIATKNGGISVRSF